MFVFQARPGRAGDDLTRLRLNIAEADLLVFFVQRQMRMVAAGKFAQRFPRLHSYLTVSFRRESEDHLSGVNSGLQLRLAFRRAFRLGVVELTQQVHLALGIPGDTFTAVADGFQQRADRGETLVGRRIITLDRNNMRRGFTWDQVTFAFFPVFNVKRLRHFRGGIVLNRQRHDVGFFAEVAYADFREFLSDTFIDVPVAFGFPGRVNGGRQRVNKRMHIRGIHIVFFVPGCGRQYDVGIETGARQTEVERDDQIQFAVEAVIPPLDFFRLHAALLAKVFALNAILGTQQVLEHVFMTFTGGTQQVGTPDKQVTRMVFTVLRLFGRKANSPLFQRFHGVIDRRHAGFLRFVSNTQRVHAQLRRRRQPAHTLSAHVEVDQMSAVAGFIRHRR